MISSVEIADALGIHRPTREQLDVIQNAPFDAPAAVIAGAGSGKTELMSARVLWMVANQLLKPAEVLGLTFTRKAAKELHNRVNDRLNALRETSLWPNDLPRDFDPPKIATYNSFANEVFRSVSLAIGYESDVPLLGEAGTFLLARRFVDNHAFALVPNIAESDRRADSLVELVMALEAELGEHRATASEVEAYLAQLVEAVAKLPRQQGGTDTTPYSYTSELLTPLHETVDIARLAEGFREFKRRSASVDYSDQLRLAADAIAAKPELSDEYRNRFRQVLLDEYQDTSSVQVRLLASLFHSQAVIAVGDPNQSIYGWRGAAAGTMENFGARFGAKPEDVFPLSSNWRSDRKILDVANSVAASLAQASTQPSAGPLVLTTTAERPDGEVAVKMFEHELDEAAEVAKLLAGNLTVDTSAAILFRKRKHMARFAAALDAHKVPYEISGLGGLLQVPEVADLVAALRVISDPEAGVSLMRLLVGPRWRIGTSDIALLHAYAKRLTKVRSEFGAPWPVTIVEALDELAQANPFLAPEFSSETHARLTEAARLFRTLRRQLNLRVAEFARAVASELWLDIELMATGRREPLANLYSFYDLVAEFELTSSDPSLGGFLNWLDHAERKQRLEPPKNGVRRGVVQLLTIHSSKGLEWDVVAVPDLVEGEFPSEERSYRGWLAAGKLPYPLRADADALPHFDWEQAESQKELKQLLGDFRTQVKDHLYSEQGRLAYVAFTRAKHLLVLTGSYWSTGSDKPRTPSRYLELVSSALHAAPFPAESALTENPYPAATEHQIWPPKLGIELNQSRVEQSEAVLAKLSALDLQELASAADEMLSQRTLSDISFPTRLSATALTSFLLAPLEFLKGIAQPLPAEYLESAEIGTQFHEAVEQWFGLTDIDAPSPLEGFASKTDLAETLVQAFVASEYSGLVPLHVEVPIQFALGDLVVVCKLDAVFATERGLEVVDWKTGTSQQEEKMRLQLSLYRLALHKFTGRPVSDISAALFFAKNGQVLRQPNLLGEQELIDLLNEARKALQDQDSPLDL